MRFVASMGIVLVGLAWCEAADAQTREDMLRCRAITDETRRLTCYDAIDLLPASRSKYEKIDLDELKGFALSYRGQLVEVTGWVKPGEKFFFLGVDEADERTLPIDFDSLPRRDRELFLEACGEGCDATIQGRVRPVNFTTGIVADTIVAR